MAKIASFQFGTYKLLQTWLILGKMTEPSTAVYCLVHLPSCRTIPHWLFKCVYYLNFQLSHYRIFNPSCMRIDCFLPASFLLSLITSFCLILFPIASHAIDFHTFPSITVFLYTLTKMIPSIHVSMSPTYSPRLRSLLPPSSSLTLPLHNP